MTDVARKYIRFGIIALANVLIVLVLLEIFGRIFDPAGISYYPETARFLDTMIFEVPIGYRNRPNLNGRYYNTQIAINSFGIREREDLLPKPSAEKRVLMLGDSVVFGLGVEQHETLPAALENSFGEPYSVINMGVPSYNTEQELIQFQTLGVDLKPDIVLLIFITNDIEPPMWVFEKRSSWYTDLSQRTYALTALYLIYRNVRQFLGVPVQLIQSTSDAKTHPRWQAVDTSFTKIAKLCRELGLPFVVATLNGGGYNQVKELGSREGFPVFDLRPFEDVRWRHLHQKDLIVKGAGSHANPYLLKMYSTLLHEHLTEYGIVSAEPGRLETTKK